MAKKKLEKIAAKLGIQKSPSKSAPDAAKTERLESVLDDHLDQIAAAHQSTHGDNHWSVPN
jgi:hypothetical protein